jgi:hypothetical protein
MIEPSSSEEDEDEVPDCGPNGAPPPQKGQGGKKSEIPNGKLSGPR